MNHMKLVFSNPWLLLVFFVGAGLAIVLQLLLKKKYRRNRNRITSLVLHIVICALTALLFAGALITYTIPNDNNQIILLLDVSDTTKKAEQERDELVETVLSMGKYDNYQIGIVTFGFDQVNAVPLTTDVDSIFRTYCEAELPDTSATDIAAALTYAQSLFRDSQKSKILLVTDGKETDEEARSVIRSLAAKGTTVDIAYMPSLSHEKDALLIDSVLPDYHITLGEDFSLSVTVQAKTSEVMMMDLYDNGNLCGRQLFETITGTQTVTFRYHVDTYGLHEFSFRLTREDDPLTENNVYNTYLYLEQFNNILILQSKPAISEQLLGLLKEKEGEYEITVKTVGDEDFPKTLSELRRYDQVILNSISNADLPEGVPEVLYEYVYEYGGGLLTFGGSNDDGTSHAYNPEDMVNSVYQSILPVQAINYTPPIAVMVIVDRSGSMSVTDAVSGATMYDFAMQGADSCLNSLSERDYFGLMTLDSDYDTILPLTPRTQEAKIRAAITKAQELGTGGATVFPEAIQRACQALRELDVAKRHVILVTDGGVTDDQPDLYEELIKYYHDNDEITFSVICAGVAEGSAAATLMEHACEVGGGKCYPVIDPSKLPREMREDLNAPFIKDVNMKTFYPSVKDTLSPLLSGIDLTEEDGKVNFHMKTSLEGFYGSKLKKGANLILCGEYEVPVYAFWKFGKGSVGSFLCDVQGIWSSEFLGLSGNDDSGRKFLRNAVYLLMPTESVREKAIEAVVTQDNYTNRISVYTEMEEGVIVSGVIQNVNSADAPVSMNEVTPVPENGKLAGLPVYVQSALDSSNHYSRCDFVIKESGVYRITLTKQDADGNILEEETIYRALSYSEEYADILAEENIVLLEEMQTLAGATHGTVIEDLTNPYELFEDFVTDIQKEYDPRLLFALLALILFLLDIAVRKFKFKWPHEIIRDYRNKKMLREEKRK